MRDAGGVSVGAGEDRSQRAAGGSVSLCGARHHGVAARTRPGVARVIGPVRWVLAAISRRRRELFPFPARWALSVAGARRCVPLARCALPGAMPAPRVLRCCAPAVLRPCQRGRGRVGRGSCKGVGGGGSVALLFARSEKEERSWVWGTRCAESGRRCRGGSRRSFRLPAQVARGGCAARTADFRVRHRNTEMRGMT